MACTNQTLAGLLQDCDTSKGGIKKVWIATENPQPITYPDKIAFNLRWNGFTVNKEDDNTYRYTTKTTRPGSSLDIPVNIGDTVELTLAITGAGQNIGLAIGNTYGAGELVNEYKIKPYTKNTTLTLKIGEDIGAGLSGDLHLTVHLTELSAPEPVGSTCFIRKGDTGIIIRFSKNVTWYAYNFKKNTCSFTSTLNIDQANGINFVTTELILQFNRMTTAKRLEMKGLAVNDMYVIVLDSNNTYWYLGMNEPVTATSGSAQSGTAKTDGNFYQITLTDESATFPYEVLESIINF